MIQALELLYALGGKRGTGRQNATGTVGTRFEALLFKHEVHPPAQGISLPPLCPPPRDSGVFVLVLCLNTDPLLPSTAARSTFKQLSVK